MPNKPVFYLNYMSGRRIFNVLPRFYPAGLDLNFWQISDTTAVYIDYRYINYMKDNDLFLTSSYRIEIKINGTTTGNLTVFYHRNMAY